MAIRSAPNPGCTIDSQVAEQLIVEFYSNKRWIHQWAMAGFAALETHECAGSASLGPTASSVGLPGKGNRGR